MNLASPSLRPGVHLLARGLARSFEGGLVPAVRRADLEVQPGEAVAIMGPTGCGKSTLLAMLALLEPPEAGELFLDGVPAADLGSGERLRREQVGIVFQFHHLLPHLSAAENVALPLAGSRLSAAQRRERVAELLHALGLEHRARTLAARLSGGERQLVALARALVNRPRLILADEPTGAVDSATGKLLLDHLFAPWVEELPSIVLVTHDPAVAGRAHRVVPMRDGILPA